MVKFLGKKIGGFMLGLIAFEVMDILLRKKPQLKKVMQAQTPLGFIKLVIYELTKYNSELFADAEKQMRPKSTLASLQDFLTEKKDDVELFTASIMEKVSGVHNDDTTKLAKIEKDLLKIQEQTQKLLDDLKTV